MDNASLVQKNAAYFEIYDKTSDNGAYGIVIYDEKNYEEIKSIIEELMANGSGSGSGSGYSSDSGYSSTSDTSEILKKGIKPSRLLNNKKIGIITRLEDEYSSGYSSGSGSEYSSGSGSESEENMQIYSLSEFNALKEEIDNGNLDEDYEFLYIDINNRTFDEPGLTETKIDFSNATNLEEIRGSAFANKDLENIKLPQNGVLKSIEVSAFADNRLSGTLTIPSSVTSIGDTAFSYNQLSELDLSKATSLQTIGEYAFEYNQLSGTLIIPSSVTSINQHAFSSNQISTLDLSKATSLQTIGNSTFSENQLSGTLTIPSSVTSIGAYAFPYNQLSELDLSKATSLQTIGECAFEYNQLSGTLTIPSSVTSIGDSAFSGNGDGSTNKINSLVFESNSNLQTIGVHAFSYNQISGTLTIPSSVTSIGDSAFNGNQISGTLIIPSSVISIGNSAFEGSYDGSTNKISELIFESNSNLQTIGYYAFHNNQLSGTLTIPNSVTSIGIGVFMGNQISTLDLSKATNLQTIGNGAFSQNQLSGTLTISSSVTSIGAYAFSGNYDGSANRISSLVFESNSNLQTIGAEAFENNQLSGTLTIPSSVTSIGDDAFAGTSSTNKISSLVFENNSHLQTIGNRTFENNQLSGTLTIPSSVTSIGKEAFRYNELSTLNIGSGLVSLGESAFSAIDFQTINIDMTESTWNSRGLPTSGWYSANITPTYKQE